MEKHLDGDDRPPRAATSVDLHEGRKSKPHVDDNLIGRREVTRISLWDFPVGNPMLRKNHRPLRGCDFFSNKAR
jgi:hypothetical protein